MQLFYKLLHCAPCERDSINSSAPQRCGIESRCTDTGLLRSPPPLVFSPVVIAITGRSWRLERERSIFHRDSCPSIYSGMAMGI